MNTDLRFPAIETIERRARLLALDSIRATTAAGSGHPTSCLSSAEIIATLFFAIMKYNPLDPKELDNDRLILSKGHAAPIIYAAWKQIGILSDEELLTLRKYDSVLEGHPTPRWQYHEAATGSLGQGLAIGVGTALAAEKRNKTCKTFVLLGDGECAEGSVWEAASLASYYHLHHLTAILDLNRLGQTGKTAYGHSVETFIARFSAFGWNAIAVDGHSIKELLDAFKSAATTTDRPTILIAKTYKGHGFDFLEDKENMHGKALSKDECLALSIETEVKKYADLIAPKKNLSLKEPTFEKMTLPPLIDFSKTKEESTRKAAGRALAALGKINREIVALDADVNNSTYLSFFAQEAPERFIQCWVAEQAMISIASGFALRGFIPFASTFSAFFSRAFDQIRMAAIGKTPLRLIGTHSGVSIGQDGPSQMGLEDIACMRTLPDSIVLYPSDARSAEACVALAAAYHQGVSYIRTTRSETAHLYDQNETFELGKFKIVHQSKNDQVLIIAAGITLHHAIAAQKELAKENISCAIVDLYSVKPLDAEGLIKIAQQSQKKIVIVEDHYQAGGIGEAVMSATAGNNFQYHHLCVKEIPRSGSEADLLKGMNIDTTAIINTIKRTH
jgi:transketolase